MVHATYEDSELIMKLYDLRREEKLRKARDWFQSEFSAQTLDELMQKYPAGSPEHTQFRMVLGYWDMAASFVIYSVVHEELFFESNGEMLLVWEKVKPFMHDFRRMRNNPLISRNLEGAATRYIAWLNRTAPGTYESLLSFIRPPH